jgi:hypothetical protein
MLSKRKLDWNSRVVNEKKDGVNKWSFAMHK